LNNLSLSINNVVVNALQVRESSTLEILYNPSLEDLDNVYPIELSLEDSYYYSGSSI
jgi:hypothetical protein